MLTRDEARRIAANIAKPPLRKPRGPSRLASAISCRVRAAFQCDKWITLRFNGGCRRGGPCLEERINTMSETLSELKLCDEETLTQELPDAALEVAAGKYCDVGNPFTIAFCTGLDTCPA
jgi:hypothetical protein